MTDEQIIKYVRNMIVKNLEINNCYQDIFYIVSDKTNKILLEHIIGLIALFEKAKEILEKDEVKDE